MAFSSEFVDLALDQLHREAAVMKAEGWRFMQTHAVNTDEGVDLYYSFMKDGLARNYKVRGVGPNDAVPSITDLFLAAFVFENEARELFGVDMRDIALDFQGAMYAPAESEPMRFITPEQKAAREKAAKAAAAKAAKEASTASDAQKADATPAAGAAKLHVFVMTPERRARLDAKLANMSPDKVAKVEAALKAREAEAAAAASAPAAQAAASEAKPEGGAAKPVEAPEAPKGDAPVSKEGARVAESADRAPVDEVLEAKIAALPPEKAAKVRAALGVAGEGGEDAPQADESANAGPLDAELEAKLALLDGDKQAKVRAALGKGARNATSKGGE